MFAYGKRVVFAACVLLSACGKSAAPQLSAQDAYTHCTSNQVLGMQLSAASNNGEKDLAEATGKIINACMEKQHFRCERTSPEPGCNWIPIK